MVRDVCGDAAPVSAGAFRFKDPATRDQKREAYLASTACIADPEVRKLAQHLMLSNQFKLDFTLGEQKRGVSAREIITGYSGEPDWGMDKGLDASTEQKLMGGTDPAKTSSQGFRHMSFLLGRFGQAPQRAQLLFDLGERAITKGHAYWGFRFIAWGTHYLEDMGAPVHTNMLPTLKYIQLKGMLFPKDEQGARHFNKKVIGDVVFGSASINANYHFLYEHLVDTLYTGKSPEAATLAAAVEGKEKGGLLSRMFGPRTIESVAKRRAWSRLSTPGIARSTVRFFTEKYRQPVAGGPSNVVGLVDEDAVKRAVEVSGRRLAGENAAQYAKRLAAEQTVVRLTARQFQRNGVALRQAFGILERGLAKRR
jgi:hypothetical protein